MRLLLTVLGAQRSQLGDRALHEFDARGGTLGRSASCDWTLPDPGNTLSARHATISCNGHGFVVTDTSTNGVYLNGVDAPLGRGQSAPLASGDSLYISDYVISVTILKEAAQPVSAQASPLYVPPPAPVAAFPSAAHVVAPTAFSLPGQGAPQPARPADRFGGLSMDDLLGPAPAAPPPLSPPVQAAPAYAAPPAPAFAPPPVQPPVSLAAQRPVHQAIPDDFDFSDLMPGGAPMPAPAAMAPPQPAWPAPAMATPPVPAPIPAAPALPPMPQSPPAAPLSAVPDGYAMPGAQPPQPAAPRPAEPLDPLAMLRQRAVARAASIDLSPPGTDAAQPPVPAPRPAIGAVALPGGAGAPSAGGDDAVFWEALGLDPAAIPPAQRQDMLADLGRAMRETASGLVAILSARKSMKDEFRIDQTRLAAHENNPFKFFRSGDEALRRVVAEAKPGYLPLDKAVRQGFADIQAHEVATVVAMQNALRKLLASLAPVAIEAGAERGLLGGRPDRGKMWERYAELHAGLAGDLDRTTREMLADELARAYAQQAGGGEGGR